MGASISGEGVNFTQEAMKTKLSELGLAAEEEIDDLIHSKRDVDKLVQEVLSLQEDMEGMSLDDAVTTVFKRHRELAPIRFIPFDKLKENGSLPRLGYGTSIFYPDAPATDLTVEMKSIDRENSFFVFISHCWISGWDGKDTEGNVIDEETTKHWRGYPHVDTKDDAKYKLLVKAVELIHLSQAKEMENVYIWIDFSCMDQNGNPAGELKQLDRIIQSCDCLITPIVDPNHDKMGDGEEGWEFPTSITNWFEQYAAKRFCKGQFAYVNRAWCRVEMLYAANIPLADDNFRRTVKFTTGLKFAASKDMRPHYVYGDKDMATRRSPTQLPPLANSHLKSLSPEKCIQHLTVSDDAAKIHELMEDLKKYMKEIKSGYVGDRNATGQKHGKGKYTWASGEIYEGEYENDQMSGHGWFAWATGNIYEGQYKNGKRNGKGTLRWASGEVFEGDYVNDRRHGHGKMQWPSGNTYDGGWVNDQRSGMAVFNWPSGDKYEGNYVDGKKNGQGKFTYADGSVYQGNYVNDQRHGRGYYRYVKGDIYDGEWENNNKQGRGRFTWADKGEYEGEWRMNKQHGENARMKFSDGAIYTGPYVDGKRVGEGTLVWPDGDKFEGPFKGNKSVKGKGVLTVDGKTMDEGEIDDKTRSHW